VNNAMDAPILPPDFPPDLVAEALVHSGEATWRPELAVLSVEWLGAHGYAVLGTEVFVPQQGGLQSLPYFQSVDRREGEDWNSFVGRAAAQTISYLKTFEERFKAEGDVYVNVTWISCSEFKDLKAT
jgi:hypothetical protein